MKISRKSTMLKKYGVTNASHIPAVKEKISNIQRARWYEIFKNRNFSNNDYNKETYKRKVYQYANTQYTRYKKLLDPENKRSNDWHLDHIYSVTDGWLNDVPMNIISDVTNLRIISAGDNYRKHIKSDKTLIELYEDYKNA